MRWCLRGMFVIVPLTPHPAVQPPETYRRFSRKQTVLDPGSRPTQSRRPENRYIITTFAAGDTAQIVTYGRADAGADVGVVVTGIGWPVTRSRRDYMQMPQDHFRRGRRRTLR
jgi:hypothetical protein